MGGYDKGVVVEGLARAAKKAGSASSSSPVIVRIVGVNDGDAAFLLGWGGDKGIREEGGFVVVVAGAGVGGARGGGDVGVPQVQPAERPVEEAMLVVPGVKG